jgi:hypothetical protein
MCHKEALVRVQISILSILMISGLACDSESEDLDARLIQCDASGLHALPGECPCEPGQRSLSGDCVPDDLTPGPDEPGDCRFDGTDCDERPDDRAEPPPPASCGYRTHTQDDWGSACDGESPGCYRDAHFQEVFPEGLYVGCGVLTANLTNSLAVRHALPTAGEPRALLPGEAGGYDGVGDPKVATALFGEVVALSLSVGFDELPGYDDHDQLLPLAFLQIADPNSLCAGMFVHEVLQRANDALGDCPSQLSAVAAYDCLAAINAPRRADDACEPRRR